MIVLIFMISFEELFAPIHCNNLEIPSHANFGRQSLISDATFTRQIAHVHDPVINQMGTEPWARDHFYPGCFLKFEGP